MYGLLLNMQIIYDIKLNIFCEHHFFVSYFLLAIIIGCMVARFINRSVMELDDIAESIECFGI